MFEISLSIHSYSFRTPFFGYFGDPGKLGLAILVEVSFLKEKVSAGTSLPSTCPMRQRGLPSLPGEGVSEWIGGVFRTAEATIDYQKSF